MFRLKAFVTFLCFLISTLFLTPAVAYVPTTNHLSAWPAQDLLDVSGFEVAVIPANRKLMKDHASVLLHLRGTLKAAPARERPYIEAIHVSERFVPDDRDPKRVAELVLTPIVGLRKDPRYSGAAEDFAIDAQYRIYSWTAGTNTFAFRCGGVDRTLSLDRAK